MKGKKILVIVIIIVAVLAVAGTVFGYLFLKTDLLKSNKELFAKYVNQNFDSFKEISNLKIIDTYKNLKNEDKYESNSELNVIYSEGGEVSSPYNNLKAKLNIQKDDEQNYYYADGTASANSGVSVNLGTNTITVTGDDSSNLLTNGDTCTFTFKVTFRTTNRNYINNTSFTTLTVDSFKTTITVGDYTPYGTISDTEKQMILSYRKCIPVDSNGNISVELIDNPFMNRPLERGFNGWKTNNSKYSSSINTNTNTFVQTLKTNVNNIKDSSGNYVIDLYTDWAEANVIFVSSTGSSTNSGKTPNSPINNNWTNINSKINSNIKTCTKASNREVNIIVLMQGTLDASGLTGPNTAYTLTSLYNGKNYGSTNTYLSAGSSNAIIDSDLQLDYIYIFKCIIFVIKNKYRWNK